MHTIAVLGLGRMGQGIAGRLLQAGFRVRVWNRTREKAAQLVEQGARWAESPAAAARDADIVVSMVADDIASTAVWEGDGCPGALDAMRPGAFLVECSTLSSSQVAKLNRLAVERGLHYIDCPVTGVPEVAAAGKLTLLVGAGTDDLERVRPVLNAFSISIRHFGAVGTGTAYKLMINLMGAVQIAALAEGIALAEKLGLDRETVIAAIESSAAASPQVVRYARKMAERNFAPDPAFTLALRHKDAVYGVALADRVGSAVSLGRVSVDWFALAEKQGADRDEAMLIEIVK